jgi:hypothetical protein
MNEDIRHLELLSIFHYVVAAITALVGCFPIIHLVVGILILTGGMQDHQGQGPPPWFGIIFVGTALFMILMCWTTAALMFVAGSRLKKHVGYYYCLVIAAVECIFFPFGTVLGVLTIIVLMRPSIKSLFGVPSASVASNA